MDAIAHYPLARASSAALYQDLRLTSPEKALEVARDFEAVFVNELLDHMDEGLKTDGPFAGGPSEGVYRSLLNDSVAREIVKAGGIGIAESIYREILKLQEIPS